MQFSELYVGQSTELRRRISDEDVRKYAELVGDWNPIHLDEAFAAKTKFQRRIAHGMLCAGIISATLGTALPGPGAVYLSQSVRFLAPVFIDDEIVVTVTVVELIIDRRRVRVSTTCRNQRGEAVLEGEALLALPREH